MSTTVLEFSLTVNGALVDATSAVLSDPTGTFGARRTDTNAVVVADGAVMIRDSQGRYSYSFTDPAANLPYEYWVEWTYNGKTYHTQKFSTGAPAAIDIGTPEGQILVNLPAGVSLTINGVTIDPTSVLAMADVGGSVPLALAWIYRALESDNMQSETIGKYSYTKWLMRGSDYWELRAANSQMNANAPNVIARPSSIGCWPWGSVYP